MAINQNHLAEELNSIKCAVVEKQVSKERAEFLKTLLEYNHYEVVVVPSPPPKTPPVATAPAGSEGGDSPPVANTAVPIAETFSVGVTDVMFNATNAIFGRLLQSPGGHIVTLAYWQQRDQEPHDEVPYFEKTNGHWGGR
jgi:hypothetical protein